VEIVCGAPKALVEQNTFYLHLKMALGQKNQELLMLREASNSLKKELNKIKARNKTLEKYMVKRVSSYTSLTAKWSSGMIIKEFVSEYHDMKATSSNSK
jgi:hypothetical protein